MTTIGRMFDPHYETFIRAVVRSFLSARSIAYSLEGGNSWGLKLWWIAAFTDERVDNGPSDLAPLPLVELGDGDRTKSTIDCIGK